MKLETGDVKQDTNHSSFVIRNSPFSPRLAATAETFRVLAGPLLAATLAAVAGFLPVTLADHIAGEYLADLVPVMAIALFFSYLYAFTVTPFLCHASTAATPVVACLESAYRAILPRILARPRTTIAAATVITAIGLLLLALRPSTFFPDNNRTMLAIETILPVDASQARTAEAIQQLGKQIQDTFQKAGLTGKAEWVSFCGCTLPRYSRNIAPAAAGPNAATILISFDTAANMASFQAATAFENRKSKIENSPLLRIHPIAGGPQVAWPVKIRVTGPAAELAKALPAIGKELAACPGLANLHQEGGGTIAKWQLTPKRKVAADKGVTPADIALAMNVVTNGLPVFDLGSGDQALPVIVRPKKTATDAIENMQDAYVYPNKGLPCIMSDVAEIKSITAPATIERVRGTPCATFVADCAPGTTPYAAEREAVARLQKLLVANSANKTERARQSSANGATQPSPARQQGDAPVAGASGSVPATTLTVESAGLAKTATEANNALVNKIPWALAAVFLVLLFQTRSFRLNLLTLAAIPFGVAGAGFGLALFGMPTGFMPLIGLTAMAGIAVNITIVMVASIADRQKALAETGNLKLETGETEAASVFVRESPCPSVPQFSSFKFQDDSWIIDGAVDRIEPILLSAACAVGGMIPLYLFGGELWHSLAVTLVTGLLLAALLVALIVPAVFKLLAGKDKP